MLYPSTRVFKCAQHHDFADFMVVAGDPEVLDCLLDWGLCKVRVDGAVQDAPHQTGIHVEVCHDRTLHAVMLV